MPERDNMRRASRVNREGKAATTQAGEFVREEMHHIREGKHGAKNTEQAIAIGLSKARRSGVKLRAPKKGTTSKRTRTQAKRDLAKGSTAKKRTKKPSATRSRATTRALRRQPRRAASKRALSRHARAAAKR